MRLPAAALYLPLPPPPPPSGPSPVTVPDHEQQRVRHEGERRPLLRCTGRENTVLAHPARRTARAGPRPPGSVSARQPTAPAAQQAGPAAGSWPARPPTWRHSRLAWPTPRHGLAGPSPPSPGRPQSRAPLPASVEKKNYSVESRGPTLMTDYNGVTVYRYVVGVYICTVVWCTVPITSRLPRPACP